jgi:superfamily II DNA or RNA helicase/HKD family nuclease
VDNQQGVFEELLHKNKPYPTNQHTSPLLPQQYSNALIQQMIKDISQSFQQLAADNQYEKIFELTDKIRRVIREQDEFEYDLPLKAIHYRNDERMLPMYPEFFLSHPLLLTNSSTEQFNLFKALKYELQTADHANFMVSFIRWSGLQLLIRPLDEFRQVDASNRLRILTSTYLNITEPKALYRLLEMPHVETRIFDSGSVSFHTKAYLFERHSGLNSSIIGSSNLSKAALNKGYEWNVKLPDTANYSIYDKALKSFQLNWDDSRAIPLQEELIRDYEKQFMNRKIMLVSPYLAVQHIDVFEQLDDSPDTKTKEIIPNRMQQEALEALRLTRVNGHNKGVVIAATGTGKTYLSAFDVKNFGAKRILFLAHRDEILESAKATFIKVFGTPNACGKLSGFSKDWDKPFLFATVQTLSRADVINHFSAEAFDYVIVDEFHHAEAATYKKVMDHFKPKFLLGLTATPDRMDGRDVLVLCDHNVVYEIRLRDALNEGLLTPFRYFGLSDPTIDYTKIDLQKNGQFVEDQLVGALNTHERVDYIINMIEKFGFDGTLLKGLGFCASIEHAKYMTDEFNKSHLVAGCLTGEDTPARRQELIARLESDEDPLQIIFTVNIFNEGVDIPKLNVILFLRPTESATIFIQQLGRGLRKIPGKEYVTVLDFIGNYHKSFIVPLALSGQNNHKAFDRDSLRVAIETEFADLPDGCFVDLEEVSKQQILKKIETIRMDRDLLLTDLYNQFKKELGYSPEINDFLYFDGAPSIHFFINKYGSWVETKRKMRDLNEFDQTILEDSIKLQMVQRLEKLLPIKWPYEYSILAIALVHLQFTIKDVIADLQYRFALQISEEMHGSKIEKAMQKLATASPKHNWSFGDCVDEKFTTSLTMQNMIREASFKDYLNDRIEYGLAEFRRMYRPNVFFSSEKNVILYQNYTRNDLMYLFESDAAEGSWREGISKVGNHILLFINLKKDEQTADHLQYHDYLMDQQHFHWQTQNATFHESSRGQEYIHHKKHGKHIHLFIRKFESMHGVTLPFTYLGEIDYISSHGDRPMNIKWRLHHTIPEALFTDLVR